MIRRPPRSTLSSSSAASDVYKRQFEQWAPCKNMELTYSGNDTWDHMFQQGIQLLERFIQDGRVQIRQPHSHQQIRFTRTLSSGNSFVAFVDAVGELDNT